MKEPNIKVVIVEPMKKAYEKVIPNTLEAKQKIVDGDIECCCLCDKEIEGTYAYCNDEGKINGSMANRAVYDDGELVDVIYGAFVIVGDGEDGEDGSLTDAQVKHYLEAYKTPSAFIRVGDDIIELPL